MHGRNRRSSEVCVPAEADEAAGEPEQGAVDVGAPLIADDLTLTNLEDEPATILEDAVRLVGGNGNEYTV